MSTGQANTEAAGWKTRVGFNHRRPTSRQFRLLSIGFMIVNGLDTIFTLVQATLIAIVVREVIEKGWNNNNNTFGAIVFAFIVFRLIEVGLGWAAIITLKSVVMHAYITVAALVTIFNIFTLFSAHQPLDIFILLVTVGGIILMVLVLVQLRKEDRKRNDQVQQNSLES